MSGEDVLPDDPSQELLPAAEPEPQPSSGEPVDFEADRQTRVGDVLTLDGHVVIHYRDYTLQADKIVYNQSTSAVEAEGHLKVTGGPNNVEINASHGDLNLNMHTARFYNVSGSQGLRAVKRSTIYSTSTPFLFTARVLLELGDGNYRLIDGTMTNCQFPRPDWRIISRAISLEDDTASTKNAVFEFLNVPLFYVPLLRHPTSATGRESGFLIPVISNSSIKGYVFGEQVYWAINRSMDMTLGTEYFSKRGWAPNGGFRYRGRGTDHLIVRWDALLDRGVEQKAGTGAGTAALLPRPASVPAGYELVNQGGVDVAAYGRKDFTDRTYAGGIMEYLSNYDYRLIFNDNFSEAISSQVASNVWINHVNNGRIPSISLERFETFASSAHGDEARILHLPNVRYDVLDRPLGGLPAYWGLASSAGYLARSEPNFHARNVGRVDLYPHLALPLHAAGWSLVPEGAIRATYYTISQVPDLTGAHQYTPTISHDPENRVDAEFALDLRAPALERDFLLRNRVMRHVIEPELTYRYVTGIGTQARNILLMDTTDVATDTNEVGFSLNQRLFLRPRRPRSCTGNIDADDKSCLAQPREWASWRITQNVFLNSNFGGAVIPGRRNVFESTLDMTAAAFLTDARNLAPVTSRLRFEAIDNLRIQWDLDYDPKLGQMNADNLFAGYRIGKTTVGVTHAMLNAVDETPTAATHDLKSQIVTPFIEYGKQSGPGFDFAANGGYDFVTGKLQHGGLQGVYNWDCCGLTFGYRVFELGTVGQTGRDEHQWLFSFTLANIGSVGDIRRSNTIFHDTALPPVY